MDLSTVLSALAIDAPTDLFTEHWEDSEACFPDVIPRFLEPNQIGATRAFGGLPSEADAGLLDAAQRIVACPELLHLAWHCHRVAYEHLDYESGKLGRWPVLADTHGDVSGAFYLLIALEAIPRMRAVHETLGVNEEVSRESCSHYPEVTERYREHHAGRFGFLPRSICWLRNHIKGDLYGLGRLEYMLKPFRGNLRAYRNRVTREVIALADPGQCFDSEGLVAKATSPDPWTATRVEDGASVTGYPISPQGYVARREVTLDLDDWDLALSPGDMVLETHIPAGGNMTLERCHDSMRRALEFFPRIVPERPFAGFACDSWILNPELDRIYRPNSNIVLWQRELHLFPIATGNRCGVYFVFGTDDVDLDSAPRDTSMRRALLDHLTRGGRLIGGGMFMLLEDFSHFGTQVYRRKWDRGGGERDR